MIPMGQWPQKKRWRVVHMVSRSLWEILENGDRVFSQNFDTNLVSIVVWPGEPFWGNCLFWPQFQDSSVHLSTSKFPKWIPSQMPLSRKLLQGCHVFFFQEHVLKMDSFANVIDSKDLSSISRTPGNQNGSFSSISRIPGNQNGLFASISRIPGDQYGLFSSISRFPGH